MTFKMVEDFDRYADALVDKGGVAMIDREKSKDGTWRQGVRAVFFPHELLVLMGRFPTAEDAEKKYLEDRKNVPDLKAEEPDDGIVDELMKPKEKRPVGRPVGWRKNPDKNPLAVKGEKIDQGVPDVKPLEHWKGKLGAPRGPRSKAVNPITGEESSSFLCWKTFSVAVQKGLAERHKIIMPYLEIQKVIDEVFRHVRSKIESGEGITIPHLGRFFVHVWNKNKFAPITRKWYRIIKVRFKANASLNGFFTPLRLELGQLDPSTGEKSSRELSMIEARKKKEEDDKMFE